jgi:cell division protein FtsB
MKKGRILIIVLFAAFLVGAVFFLFGRQGIYYQRRELVRKDTELKARRHTVDSLSDIIGKLTNDTAYIERIAREKLGMARKNEKVYKFIEKGK